MAVMQTPKRKRPVTSCGECYRRKQRCSRTQPCNICISRRCPDKCFFGENFDGNATQDTVEFEDKSFKKVQVSRRDDEVEPIEGLTNLAEQTGYTALNGTNAWISLEGDLRRTGLSDMTAITIPDDVRDEITEIVNQLPHRSVQTKLIDVFFDNALWWFSGLDPYYFRNIYKLWQASYDEKLLPNNCCETPRDVLYFPGLLFQTFAAALQFLHPDAYEDFKPLNINNSSSLARLSAKYSRMGMRFIDALGRHNSALTAVQHDLIRGLWLKNVSRGSESWYSLGNAIRQAQELGLHLHTDVYQSPGGDVKDTLRRLWYDEYKRRVWVCLFAWDSHMSLILGRPRMINAGDCTIKLPVDSDIPDDPSEVVPSAVDTRSIPSSISPLLFQYNTGLIIHEMFSSGADKPTLSDYGIIQKLHDKVVALMENVSPFVRPNNPDKSWDGKRPVLVKQRNHLASSGYSYLMALHRPHAGTHTASRDTAIMAALRVLEAQQRIYELSERHLLRIYVYSFYTINSAIFLSAMMLEYQEKISHDTRVEICIALDKAIARLGVIKEVSPMARSGEQILLRCSEKIKPLASSPTTNLDTLANALAVQPPNVNNTSFRPETDYHTEQASAPDDVFSTKISVDLNGLDWPPPDSGFHTAYQSWMSQMDQIIDPAADVPLDESIWNSLMR